MFLGMNNTRMERKILIILDFENRFLLCDVVGQFGFPLLGRIVAGSGCHLVFMKL